ncbi:hypothetical protein OA954_02790 [Alphaproteobacteria bacterium]|nr:hypothetical protein [Alphaproteobacteria bacterium]
MKSRYREVAIYFSSILVLILFINFSVNYITTKPLEIINFIQSDIHEDFEIEITNNLKNINNYLKEYLFIDSHLIKRNNGEINIQINIKKPFAINNFTKEVIFYDNTTASSYYFKQNYLDKINLIDISKNSLHINNYLNENYQILFSLFNINQIEYIDDRRYNLVLSNGRIVMLPKVIDSKLINFIKNNINLIDKSTNYQQFLDLRNFHNKTIRLK